MPSAASASSTTSSAATPAPSARARRKRRLRGLDTYRVLKNPAYAHAFAISGSFAANGARFKNVAAITADTFVRP